MRRAIERTVSTTPSCRRRWLADDRGEALPVAILFVGVMVTVLLGVHILVVALARTAIQSAADTGVSAAQVAGTGFRVDEGVRAARIAMAGARSSAIQTRLPEVVVKEEQGVVEVRVFGGVFSPILGSVKLVARACGPLDDVPAERLTDADSWQC